MANMLYNGVELPDIESVWTDKETYPYATYNGQLLITSKAWYATTSNGWMKISSCSYKTFNSNGSEWILAGSGEWYDGQSLAVAPVWVSYDFINTTDGTTYLAASDPVDPNASTLPDLTSAETLRWISLGMAVRRGIRARGEATMYSYNGTVLPKLPESELSYAALREQDQEYPNRYILVLFSAVPFINSSQADYMMAGSGSPVKHATYRLYDDGEWKFFSSGTTGAYGAFSLYTQYFWSNVDIYDKATNTVYLAKSDPIPVYG